MARPLPPNDRLTPKSLAAHSTERCIVAAWLLPSWASGVSAAPHFEKCSDVPLNWKSLCCIRKHGGLWGRAMTKVLTVCIFLLGLVGAAADSLIAPSTQESEQSIAFDNWEIRHGLLDHSYMLIGRSREGDGHFWLHCDSNGFINIAVPLVERNGRDRLRSFPVTVWSDEQKRHELSLVVFENFVALAIAYQGGRNEKLETFLDVLQTARRTFAIAYDSRVFQFDVSKLPEARARFMQLCNARPMHASLKSAD
jgi:hypothetical protein